MCLKKYNHQTAAIQRKREAEAFKRDDLLKDLDRALNRKPRFANWQRKSFTPRG